MILILIDFKNNKDSNFEKLHKFCDTFTLTDIVACHSYFLKVRKSSIELLLTNRKSSFQLTQVRETGISDVHLLVSTFMKAQTVCLKPQKIACSNYKHFDEHIFLEDPQSVEFSPNSDCRN